MAKIIMALFAAAASALPSASIVEAQAAKPALGVPAGTTSLLQSDVLGIARYFADHVLPSTSGGGKPGESSQLSAVRHIFGVRARTTTTTTTHETR